MSFPITLSPGTPTGLDSPRLGDDELRSLKQLLADLFTLPVSPSTISATIGSVSTGGKLTITNGTWTGDVVGRAYGGTGLSVAGTSGNLLTSDGTNWTSAAPPVVNHAILSATHTDSTAAAVVRGDLMVGIGVTPKWERVAKGAEGTIVRAGATEPAYTTATYPDTTTINQLLYSSSANVLAGLATGNSGVLVTSGAGVPSIATDIPTAVTIGGAYLYRASGTDVAVADGGTGLSSGTSGGVLGYTATGTLASSVLLTANALVLGGGAGATPTPMGSLGTTTTLLHGNAAGAPTFGAVSLTADVSGILPTANGGTGIAYFTAAGPTAARVYTFPDVAGSVPLLAVANAFTATQTFSNATYSALFTGGNVGIGTTTPGGKLQVNGAAAATALGTPILRLDAGVTHELDMGSLNGGSFGYYVQAVSNDHLSLYPLLLNPSGGNVGIGTTGPSTLFHVLGADNSTVGTFEIAATSANVTAADIFIDFRSSSGSIGSIAGTAVSGVIAYNTFTGSHYTQVEEADRAALKVGMLLEATGDSLVPFTKQTRVRNVPEKRSKDDKGNDVVTPAQDIEESFQASTPSHLVRSRISRTKGSKAAYGVWGGIDKEGRDMVLALGTGMCFVANTGKTVEVGDYLMASDVPGAMELQPDDVYRNGTVAKAMAHTVWQAGEQQRTVPCIYLGG